jgi:hypothetical protein
MFAWPTGVETMDWRARIAEFEQLNPQDESGRIAAPPPKPAPVADMTPIFGWLVLAFLFIPVAIVISLIFPPASAAMLFAGLWALLLSGG